MAELAECAGMAASTVSRLETGVGRLSPAHVERLARALERPTRRTAVDRRAEALIVVRDTTDA